MEKARISAQHGAHATHEARAARSAGKAAATPPDSAQGTDAQGFSLLLASMADGAAQPVDGAAATAGPADIDPAQLAAFQGGLPYGLPPGAPVQAAGADVLTAAGRWLGGGKAGVESLVGQTAMLDGAAETAAVNGTAAPAGSQAAGRGHAFGRMAAGQAGAAADGAGGLGTALNSALRGGARAERKGSGSADLAAATAAAAQAPASLPGEHREIAQLGGAAGAGSRTPPEGAPPALPAGALAGLAEAAAGADGRSAGRGGESAGGNGTPTAAAGVGNAGAAPSGPDAAFSLDAAAAEPAQAAMEDQLAEQVAFWVHQKTQNAELTLDGDGQPVQVTVSLTGNEAHVAFRSDQAQTRDLLDASVAQLRDLLRGEGLQLSGVTVGTSGDQGARDGAGPRDGGRQGARQATVQAVAPAGTAGRASAAADRALDIFV